MRTEASFQQILEDKIKNQSPSQKLQNPTQQYFNQDPAHLAYLMGHIGQSHFRPNRTYPSRPKPSAPPHSLTEEQQLAMDFFTHHGIALSPAFTRGELKKAFRTLALRLHPDMNKGAVSAFIELKNNYETLNVLF